MPRSWVKRVLEVDGKDSRVLDLDPELPLKDQLPALETGATTAAVTPLECTAHSMASGLAKRDTNSPAAAGGLPYTDTFASVKAELAVMTARAGRFNAGLRAAPSDEERVLSNGGIAGGEPTGEPSRADLTSAAVAASNERMERLRAIRDDAALRGSDVSRGSPRRRRREAIGVGRRRQSVDEIRRRLPSRAAAAGSGSRQTFPQGQAETAEQASSGETLNGEGKQPSSGDDCGLPLKGLFFLATHHRWCLNFQCFD